MARVLLQEHCEPLGTKDGIGNYMPQMRERLTTSSNATLPGHGKNDHPVRLLAIIGATALALGFFARTWRSGHHAR